MRYTVSHPSCSIATLRFTFIRHLPGFMHGKAWRAALVMDGEEVASAEVSFPYDWLETGIGEALRAFGLDGGAYRVPWGEAQDARHLAAGGRDFCLTLRQEAVCRAC